MVFFLEGRDDWITMGPGGNGQVCYLDHGDNFMAICQNAPKCTL